MIKAYQTLIVVGVLFADVYWDWNSEGYAAIAVGVILAYLLTIIPIKIYDWSIWLYRVATGSFRIVGNLQGLGTKASNHWEV